MRRIILSYESFCRRHFRGEAKATPISIRWTFYQDYVGSAMTYENYKRST